MRNFFFVKLFKKRRSEKKTIAERQTHINEQVFGYVFGDEPIKTDQITEHTA